MQVKKSIWLGVLSSLLVLAVCNRVLWRKHAVSVSRDGSFRLVVWAGPNGPDESVRICLSKTRWVEWLRGAWAIYRDPRDRLPDLTEVYWDSKSASVGVLVCDSLAGNILFAYDLLQKRPISSETVVDGIRQSLRARYNLTESQLRAYNDDPIKCACDYASGTSKRFRQLIGESANLPPVRVATAEAQESQESGLPQSATTSSK